MRIPVVTFVFLVSAVAAVGTQSPNRGAIEWTDYGGDLTEAKDSTSADITRDKVSPCRSRGNGTHPIR